MNLSPDTKLRNKWFVSDAMSHPAKGHLGLWWELLERYTEPGQWVLDPMAGIGTTLVGCLMGRNVIANEMEQHFVEPMAASWAKMQTQGPMLGYQMGQAVIVRGDARCLPLSGADAIVTSPPYEGALGDGEGPNAAGFDRWHGRRFNSSYTRPVEAVVTSPPYEGSIQGNGAEEARKRIAEGKYNGKRPDVWTSLTNIAGSTYGNGYSSMTQNIGNLRGATYWLNMAIVYSECHRVLIPNGVMVLVVKGYTRDKQYVDLPGQTADLIETLGFGVFDRWTREVPLSFWRTLQKQKGNWDEALRYEHVIAARRQP